MSRLFLVLCVSLPLLLSACLQTLPPAPSKPLSLQGVTWRLTRLNGQPIPADNAPFLKFTSATEVAGSGGCNRLSGQYRQEGGRIVFRQMIVTRMACLGDRMTRETEFLKALQETTAWTQLAQEPSRLTLRDGERRPLLELEATDAEK
ncbi:MAG: META domain-containing protein [Zoogloeaceae bacterium]|jgi:heat shock protein HslJ|nr:META domain-containing protein [Zoogloeaceae bacterium]